MAGPWKRDVKKNEVINEQNDKLILNLNMSVTTETQEEQTIHIDWEKYA